MKGPVVIIETISCCCHHDFCPSTSCIALSSAHCFAPMDLFHINGALHAIEPSIACALHLVQNSNALTRTTMTNLEPMLCGTDN